MPDPYFRDRSGDSHYNADDNSEHDYHKHNDDGNNHQRSLRIYDFKIHGDS